MRLYLVAAAGKHAEHVSFVGYLSKVHCSCPGDHRYLHQILWKSIRNVWKYCGPVDQITDWPTNIVIPRALLLVGKRFRGKSGNLEEIVESSPSMLLYLRWRNIKEDCTSVSLIIISQSDSYCVLCVLTELNMEYNPSDHPRASTIFLSKSQNDGE